MDETEVFGWKVTKFIKNTNYDFVRKQILSVCGEDNVDDALNLISNWENYNSTPLLELNKLSKKLNLNNIFYKDESKRFHLKSFKALVGDRPNKE